MGVKEIMVAIFVVFIWSSNILVQKIAVDHISIYLLNFLRLVFVAPLVLFYMKEKISFSKYLISGLFWNVINFLLIGFALKSGVGAGASSLLIITNALFGVLFCALILGEKPKYNELLGMAVGSLGIYFFATNSISQNVPLSGVFLLIGASVSWGLGFTFIKKFKVGRTMGDNAWLSVISSVPLLFFCIIIEGATETVQGIMHISLISLSCIVFSSIVSTILAGYLWLNLSQKSAASSMMPFMLLLPIFSCAQSWLFMKETFTPTQVVTGSIILFGVFITQSPAVLKLLRTQGGIKER